MKRQMSIRARLTLWYAFVLLIGMLLLGSIVSITLEQRLISEIDSQLVVRVNGLKVLTEIEGESTNKLTEELHEFEREIPNGSLFEVRDAMGNALLQGSGSPRLPAEAWHSVDFETLSWHGEPIRVLVHQYQDRGVSYQAAMAIPLNQVNATIGKLRALFIAAIPGVMLVATLGGYWISRKALAPVDEITRIAHSISADNLSRRLPLLRTGDELQRMSEAWNDVLARLESALERIRSFTADASHELRTPIALIRTTAELHLRRDRDPATYRKALHDIQGHAERMSNLTNSLLNLARSDAIGSELPLAEAQLSPIVRNSVQQLKPLAEDKGVSLEVDLPTSVAVAKLNYAAMERLLLMLVENAVKYTPTGGHVAVSLAEVGGQYCVSVSDSGMGIDQAALPHIFERFYRADPARPSNGTGLGLSIAQMIAKAHGTEIHASNNEYGGATFYFTLDAS